MPGCSVRWRPSGGRGEYEFVPSDALAGKSISVRIPELSVEIATDVVGTISQGKPRLRKLHSNDRKKLHLVPLIMAAARLPSPAREDKLGTVQWPLEQKAFIVSQTDFEIVEDDGNAVVLRPIAARILHSDQVIDLTARFLALADDIKNAASIRERNAALGYAIEQHAAALKSGSVNSINIRDAADMAVKVQADVFGASNAAAVSTIVNLPPTPLEADIKGKEGRVLIRLHSYKERDRQFVKDAKAAFKAKHGALRCECCGVDPLLKYGKRGENRIQAHHRTPLEELLPDSETTVDDLAMVCATCHDIIHAKRPWFTVEAVRELVAEYGHGP